MQTGKFIPWYVRVQNSVQELGQQFGLDASATAALKEFCMTLAKDQFKAGNNSGIAWARKTPPRPQGVSA